MISQTVFSMLLIPPRLSNSSTTSLPVPVTDDPLDDLRGCGDAYRRFALDNPTYYSLTSDMKFNYDNTGVGGNFNTFNPIAQNLIVDSRTGEIRWAVISTGDLLRAEIKRNSEIGLHAEKQISAGQLVSDTIVNQILGSRVKQPDCEYGWILDGYPRKLSQAVALQSLLNIARWWAILRR